jgi:excisionase family DNA binding protein
MCPGKGQVCILSVSRNIGNMPQTPDRVSTSQVAEMLGISRVTVARMVRDGRLPAWQIGRAYKIDRAVVEAFVKPVVVAAQ